MRRHPFRRRLWVAAIPVALVAVVLGGSATGAPTATVTTITVNTLPIANALPLDIGIQKGFFAAQGIEIRKSTLQSGNDIVLALANNRGEIGYIGYTPAMIGRTQGIPITVVAASETEGATEADNWQNVVVSGSSSIRSPQDLVGKTVALNALKGVAEIVVRGALDKLGVDSSSVKYTVVPFPAMPAALASGLVSQAYLGRTWDYAQKVDAGISAVTLEQANAVLRKYVDPQAFAWSYAGDFAKSKP